MLLHITITFALIFQGIAYSYVNIEKKSFCCSYPNGHWYVYFIFNL